MQSDVFKTERPRNGSALRTRCDSYCCVYKIIKIVATMGVSFPAASDFVWFDRDPATSKY